MDLAMQTPSSFNVQHWRLINVRDPELRKAIRAVSFDQAQVTDASLLYVICADVQAWQKEPDRYWRDAPQYAQDIILPWLKDFYAGKEQLQRDEAMRSISYISHTLMLAAKSMGYDSCPLIGFDNPKVSEMINLPKDHIVGIMLTIGKAVRPAWPKPGYISREELVQDNAFQ